MDKKIDQPMSVRPKKGDREKIAKIAETNGLSIHDVMKLCLSAGINIVEVKLEEIHSPKAFVS